ncbi:PQQ-dependent sugar dehydrogenase [Pontivivens ytuae]|uniref:PQQ-dependent sugar dehydrogenase n=1 Tax=Pontivivens ytuae TaxID=2789856 RepID=A0A7S9QDL5_9RHOB|nr:PQQ-dependent sugar dehydrogenase [Pontivivens ytuae]QPH55025.1 PQQ-dependent sugar dehydrogenase [Pontivivens ytuae]
MSRFPILAATALVPMALLAQQPVDQGPANVPSNTPAFAEQTRAPASDSGVEFAVEELATGLTFPWGIAELPDGGFLVTEREGRLRVIGADGLRETPVAGVPEVVAQRQGGLLDVALDPQFESNRVIYLTYAKPQPNNMSATAAARAVLSEDMTELLEVQDIFVQTPPSPTPMHYGSRIVLDGEYAYITTGEHSREAERVFAQDMDKTYGKVVRLTPEGEVPADNPFVGQEGALPEIWTTGHRNVQGADLHPETGQLWTLEHGPAGGDELNLATPGLNFGWPVVSYGENYSGTPVGTGQARHEPEFTEPRYYWDPVIAPGGFAFYEGELFGDWQGDILASSLRPGGLVRLELDGDTVVGEERLLGDVGRVRDVEITSDGAILVLIDDPEGSVLRLTPGPSS